MDAWQFWLVCIGSFLMGFIVMWIGLYFIAREGTFTASEYAAFLTAFFGGAVISVFTTMTDGDTKILFWVYPIGLFAAFLLYYLLPGPRTFPKMIVTERK
jgi:hypothetical protein